MLIEWDLIAIPSRGQEAEGGGLLSNCSYPPIFTYSSACPRQFYWFAAKVPTSVSPERRKSKKSNPEYLHVWQTLNRMRYSSIPFGVERPSMARRSLANALIACSALLLFQGTPSWLRKVNNLARSFSNRSFNFDAAALEIVSDRHIHELTR